MFLLHICQVIITNLMNIQIPNIFHEIRLLLFDFWLFDDHASWGNLLLRLPNFGIGLESSIDVNSGTLDLRSLFTCFRDQIVLGLTVDLNVVNG